MYVVSGSSDGTAQVWEASSGKRLLSTRSHINPAQSNDWAKVVAWSPTSKQILTGFQDGTAEALDINSRQRTAVYGGSTWGVDSANWSPDGKRVAVGRFDNTVEVYDAASGNLLHTYYTFPIFGVAWAPDDARIVTGGYKKIAQVWSVK